MYLSKCSHSVCIVMVLELTVHLDNTDLLCRQSIVPARKLPFLVPLNHASGIENAQPFTTGPCQPEKRVGNKRLLALTQQELDGEKD